METGAGVVVCLGCSRWLGLVIDSGCCVAMSRACSAASSMLVLVLLHPCAEIVCLYEQECGVVCATSMVLLHVKGMGLGFREGSL